MGVCVKAEWIERYNAEREREKRERAGVALRIRVAAETDVYSCGRDSQTCHTLSRKRPRLDHPRCVNSVRERRQTFPASDAPHGPRRWTSVRRGLLFPLTAHSPTRVGLSDEPPPGGSNLPIREPRLLPSGQTGFFLPVLLAAVRASAEMAARVTATLPTKRLSSAIALTGKG